MHQWPLMTWYRATYCMPVWSEASSHQLCGQIGGRWRQYTKTAQLLCKTDCS